MAMIKARGELQSESLVIRVTPSDRENLRLVAALEGTTISHIVKLSLIRQGVIQPVYGSDDKTAS